MESAPDLLTTAQAAAIAGVTASTVKRWADQSALAYVRTEGGHRRFERAELLRFLQSQKAGGSEEDQSISRALLEADYYGLLGAMYSRRSALGSWYEVAEEVGGALAGLGAAWERGEITVFAEHLASEQLHRALSTLQGNLRVPTRAPTVILACASGDDHTLGLALAELCFREAGWASIFSGARTPDDDLARNLELRRPNAVALSASLVTRPNAALKRQLDVVGKACVSRGIPLLLGGRGEWPANVKGAVRLSDLRELHRWLEANSR